jgi:hypothetical protein
MPRTAVESGSQCPGALPPRRGIAPAASFGSPSTNSASLLPSAAMLWALSTSFAHDAPPPPVTAVAAAATAHIALARAAGAAAANARPLHVALGPKAGTRWDRAARVGLVPTCRTARRPSHTGAPTRRKRATRSCRACWQRRNASCASQGPSLLSS